MFELKNYSLILKQTLLVMVSIIFIAGGTFYLVRKQALDSLSESLRERTMRVGEATVNRIDQTFLESMMAAEIIASQLSEKRLTREELSELMQETLSAAHKARPEILALAVAYEPDAFGENTKLMQLAAIAPDTEKTILIEDDGNYTAKDWYTKPLNMNKGVWCEPFIGDFIKEPIAVYALPFYEKKSDGTMKKAGVVCVDLSIAFIKKVISELQIPEEGYAFILSGTGRIVAHPVCEWVFTETVYSVADKLNDHNLAEIAKEMLAGKRGFTPYINNAGKNSRICYMPLESNGWSLGTVFPEEALFALMNQLEKTFITVSVLGFVLLLFIIVAISIRVSRPLRDLAKVAIEIGRGNFGVTIPDLPGNDELSSFAKAFKQMRESLIAHIENLKEVTSAKEKIESELKVAQEIQKGILPEILPPFPKCDFFEIDAFLHPAREVGGDLYDFFILNDTKICMAIGDVSGKGVPASLFMAVTQTLHRGITRNENISPGEMVTAMNNSLCHHNSAMMFVTYIFIVLDLETGVMTYCNAGHNPFYILRAGGRIENDVKKHGIPLGIRQGRTYSQNEMTLSPGDTVFFYTDGITEAKNASGEFFGNERLKLFLENENRKSASPKVIAENISKTMDAFAAGTEQADDITVLAFKLTNLKKG